MTPPQLYFQQNGIAQRVLERCTAIKQPFNPTIWAPNGHMQSALGMLRTLSAKGSYCRQLVMTSDHGTLGLDWWCGADKPSYAAPDAPIVLFIHGINGGSHEGYVKWACVAAASRGWRAVVLNMRGCNGLRLTSARGYNAINTADVHVAVHSIRSRFPAAPLMAAGYSLGSVLLAKYLAEADNGLYSNQHEQQQQQQQFQAQVDATLGSSSGDSSSSSSISGGGVGVGVDLPDMRGSGLVAAALVSPPVCLHSTNSKMGKPNSMKFMYNLAVAYKLREYVKEHLATIQSSGMNIDTEAMLSSWTVSSFDDAVTLRALGYPAPHHYYRHACSTNYIPHIRTPTLILLSRDDPFLGMLPREQVCANPFTLLAATRRGGHLAFLQGFWPLGASYCDNVIDDWLGAALQEWRHGCEQQQGALSVAPPPAAAPAAAPAVAQAAVFSGGSSSSRGRRCAAAAAGPKLPSWVDRAKAAGWQPKQFDPTSLAAVLCKCSVAEDPLAEAQAADAVLNAATAPAAAAAAAASKAAGTARHAWSFGFRGKSESSPGADAAISAPGLRGAGAWAPFEDSDSSSSGAIGASGGGFFGASIGVMDASDVAAEGGVSPAVGRQAVSGTVQQWRPKAFLRSRL